MQSATRSPRRTRVVLTALLAVIGTAAVSTVTDAAHAAPRHPTAVEAATYESAPCAVELPAAAPDDLRCGYLTVPERRDGAADPARTLRLPVAIIPSAAETPEPDPLVVSTTGGPGGGALDALPFFLAADWANADRDVILIEQRGDGLAEPSLDCPELSTAAFIDDGVLLTGDAAADRRLTLVRECRERLVEDGVDLSAYTSAASAADLADLRTALDYDAWNLYGLDYGARLAMTVLRDQPAGLRSVILDAAYPPNVDRYELLPAGFDEALSAVSAACEADERCSSAYPSLDDALERVFERAAEDPLAVSVSHPDDGSPVRIALTPPVIAQGILSALGDAESVRVLPFVIDQLARGRSDAAQPLAQRTIDDADASAEGLGLSVECAEEIPFTDDARLAAAVEAGAFSRYLPASPLRELCTIWGVPALSPVENDAVSSALPVLITSGGYDPSTPPSWVPAVVAGLSRTAAITFPYASHGTIAEDGCPALIAGAFLRDPFSSPDVSCAEREEPTTFITTADVDPTSAVRRAYSDLVVDREPVPLAVGGASLMILVLTLLYGIGYGLSWLVRRRGGAPDGAVLAASVSAAAHLAFAGALALLLVNTDRIVLAFGLPPASWPLFLLPIVGFASAVILIVLLVRAWAGGDGSLGDRIVLTASAVASVGFTGWLLVRGLLFL